MSEERPTRARGPLRAIVASLRPKQFIKNLLIFAPAIFTGPAKHGPDKWILSPGVFPRLLAVFALLSLMVGATYIINDYLDRESDRQHPRKRHRPLASGEIAPGVALAVALAIIPAVLVGVSLWHPPLGALFAGYLVATLLYSTVLKRVVIVDIMTIAGLFVLRAYVGAVALGVPMSGWFLSCVGSLALLIASAKRHHELRLVADGELGAGSARSVIREYNEHLLLMIMTVATMGALMTYTFFTLNEAPPRFGYSIPFVVFGLFRFLYLALVKGLGGSPEVTLLRDPPMWINLVIWTGLLIYIYAQG